MEVSLGQTLDIGDIVSTIADTMSATGLGQVLFSRTRLEVLQQLCRPGNPELHLREIERRTGLDSRGLLRELHQLREAGILTSRRVGRQVMYAMNQSCPVYPELNMLLAKTVGLADVVRDALTPLAQQVELAYVYGSLATGEARAESDVDLMIVGQVSMRDLATPLRQAGERLGREVNATLFAPSAYRRELRVPDSFVARVHRGPRMILLGEDRDAG